MYLLRLVVQTREKKATYKLEAATARAVIARLNKIVRVGIFEQIAIEWIDDARKYNKFTQFPKDEQNYLLDTLFHLSKAQHLNPDVTTKAGDVYESTKRQAMMAHANQGISSGQNYTAIAGQKKRKN